MELNIRVEKFISFIQEYGYNWNGLVCKPKVIIHGSGKFKLPEGPYMHRSDGFYILLDERCEKEVDASVLDNPNVKYIEYDEETFKIYESKKKIDIFSPYFKDGDLEKDLSDEWIKLCTLNIEGYAEDLLYFHGNSQIANRKNIKYKKDEVAQLIKDSRAYIADMERKIERSKHIEAVIKQARQEQQERLIKQQIELGAKDGFKDTVDNDACLKHLTDTFGK